MRLAALLLLLLPPLFASPPLAPRHPPGGSSCIRPLGPPQPHRGAWGLAVRLRGGSYNQGVDLKEVVLRGGPSKKPGAGGGGGKDPAAAAAARERKKAEEEGPGQQMPHEVKMAIQKARQAKGMTQKQLGMALNMEARDINAFEQGKAVPDNALIAKMDKILGVKLPRVKKAKAKAD